MLFQLWGKITGKDKRKQFPDQQGSVLGRLSDYNVIYPYGMYCDLPENTLFRMIGNGIAIPVTIVRPDDAAQGEPVFFHPETNTRIIPRNDGSLDIETGEGGTAPVNIKCTQANVTASESVTVDTPETTITGNGTINGNLQVDGNISTNGNVSASGSASAAGVTDTTTNVTLGTHTHNVGTVLAPDPGS